MATTAGLRRALVVAVVIAAGLAAVPVEPGAAAGPPPPSPTDVGFAQKLSIDGMAALTRVAASGDTVHVVWQDRSLTGDDTQVTAYKRSEDGGRTFTPTSWINRFGASTAHPDVAAAGDTVFMAWMEATDRNAPSHGNAEIYARGSIDGGRSWSVARQLDFDTADSYDPTIAVNGDGDAVISWRDVAGRIIAVSSDDGGATYTAPIVLSTQNYWRRPAVSLVGHRVNIAFAAQGDVVSRVSDDGGATYAPRTVVASGGASPSDVRLVSDGDNVVIAWNSAAGPNRTQVEVARSTDGGHSFSPRSTLVADGRMEDMKGADGRVYLATVTTDDLGTVWESRDGGASFVPGAPLAGIREAVVAVATPENDAIAPTARFTYTAPDRWGDDADADGLLVERSDAAYLHPSAFPIDLDACRSAGGDGAITSYVWTVSGTTLPPTTSCKLRHDFPQEGRFNVKLEVRTDSGRASSTTSTVAVDDLVIVSIGDSVASGEGTPDDPATDTDPVWWQNRRCHRSALAGPAQAAKLIEQRDPQSSVTFLHLACSGASVFGSDAASGGLTSPYEGIELKEGAPLAPQVDQLEQLLTGPGGQRKIDALFVSIGANDAKFSEVVVSCLVGFAACNEDDTEATLQGLLQTLPPRYNTLAAKLDGVVDPKRVFITGYFDPSTDETGAWDMSCVADGAQTTIEVLSRSLLGVPLPFVGIGQSEAMWASQNVVRPLNDAVKAGAEAHGWNFVDGIPASFQGHGYCSSDSWVVGLQESLTKQGNEKGAFHPNAAGHRAYAKAIADRAAGALPAVDAADSPVTFADRRGDAYLVATTGAGMVTTDQPVVVPLTSTPHGPVVGARIPMSGQTGNGPFAMAAAATRSGVAIGWTASTAGDGSYADLNDLEAFAGVAPSSVPNVAVRSLDLVQAPAAAGVAVVGKSTVIRARVANDFNDDRTVQARVRWTGPDGLEHVVDTAVRLHPGMNDVVLPPGGAIKPGPAAGALTASVTVDPFDVVEELDEEDNTASMTVPVVASRLMKVLYLPVGTDGALPDCAMVQGVVDAARPFLAGVLPVGDDQLIQNASCEAGVRAEQTQHGVSQVLASLGYLARAAGYDHAVGITRSGWLQAAFGSPVVGTAFGGELTGPPTAGALVEAGQGGDVVAHELAHTFGLEHTEALLAPGYWPARGLPEDSATDLLDPFVQKDPWIAASTWRALLDRIRVTPPDPDVIVLRGSFRANGTFDAPAWQRQTGLLDVALGATGDLTLEYRDASDALLATTGFDAGAPSEGVAPEGVSVRVPDVAGTRRLVLKKGAVVLVDRAVSAAAPTITVTAPGAGDSFVEGDTIDVTWTSSDADGDALTHTVASSIDGGATWVPIATDVVGSSLAVKATGYLVSPAVRFRVTATDGVNAASDAADADASVLRRGSNGRFAVSVQDGTPRGHNLYLLDADGGNKTLLSAGAGFEFQDVAWSRDGSTIAYVRRGSLYLIDSTTGVSRRIIESGGSDTDISCPRFSPDGSQLLVIVGQEHDDSPPSKLAVVSAATGAQVRDVATSVAGGDWILCGDWALDGRIAYFDEKFIAGDGYPSYTVRLRVIGADGSTNTVVSPPTVSFSGQYFRPHWSPDSSEIAVNVAGGSMGSCVGNDICAVAADGSTARKLAPSGSNGFGRPGLNPKWSADGKSVSYNRAERGPQDGLWVRNISGATQARAFNTFNLPELISFDWEWRATTLPAPPAPDADAGGPYVVDDQAPLTLNASATRPRSNGVPAFDWDLDGDGAYDDAHGIAPSVSFSGAGVRTVRLRVTEAGGATATDSASVTVRAVAPAVESPDAIEAGVDRDVHLVANWTDAATAAHTGTIDWGDGTIEPAVIVAGRSTGTASGVHPYASAGAKTGTISVCDGAACSSVPFTVDVSPTSEPRVAAIDPASGPFGGGTPVRLQGARLGDATGVTFGGLAASSVTPVGDDLLEVVAPPHAPGAVSVVATTPGGSSAPVTFTYTTAALPIAGTARVETRTGTRVEASLPGSSPDGRPLRYEVVTSPTTGQASVSPTGRLVYDPDSGANGTDTLTYRVSDDRGGVSAPGTVTVVVGNRPPVAGPLTMGATGGVSLPVPFSSILVGATDPDGDTLRIAGVYGGDDAHGTVALTGDTITYTPDTSYSGPANFRAAVVDGYGGVGLATVKVTVSAAPALPVDPAPPTAAPPAAPPVAPAGDGVTPGPSVREGYRLVASDGGVFTFGDAPFLGSMGGTRLNRPVVGADGTPSGKGYWLVASDGGVFTFGDADFFGSLGAVRLNQPIVGMVATPTGHGYWLVASDGGVFAFGDAGFFGSLGALRLNEPIVGMAATPSGHGYWLVASDGGVFTFGDAGFFGSGAGGGGSSVVAIASTITGDGYWLVSAGGAVRAFGGAVPRGDMSTVALKGPMASMRGDGGGYRLAATDGGVFSFGDELFLGSLGDLRLNHPVVALVT